MKPFKVACTFASVIAVLLVGAVVAPPAPAQTSAPWKGTPAPPTPSAPGPAAAGPAPAAPAVAGRPGTPAELEQRLADMHFDVGAVDGVYDEATNHAAMAFQKTYDLPRTGAVDEALILKVAESPGPPGPIVPDGEPHRVEIDLNRQTLYLYEGGSLTKILSASTGNGERFCSGGCRNAVTPTGAFRAYRQGHGWETGPLGSLYNPLYFNGGIAIHGSRSVPAGPASHGCVRIPMNSAEWFPAHAGVGMPVHVAG